jgi:threonyl-tRNA synthetase
MLVVGEQEMNDRAVSARRHGGEDLGKLSISDFVKHVREQMADVM